MDTAVALAVVAVSSVVGFVVLLTVSRTAYALGRVHGFSHATAVFMSSEFADEMPDPVDAAFDQQMHGGTGGFTYGG
jgi:hypothetical protein